MALGAHLLDLLAPPRCPACGAAAVQVWCEPCLRELAGLALRDRGLSTLGAGIRAEAAYAYAGAVRDTVLAVKLGGQHAALEAMGSLLRARLGLPGPGPDLGLTWVPATRTARRRRGVDVARRLAGPGAVPLLRVREGPEQKHLGGAERRRAAPGRFAPSRPAPRAVIVVDDVRTTGATGLAAGLALRAGGARRVLLATFAAVDPATPAGAVDPAAAAGTADPEARAGTAVPPGTHPSASGGPAIG